MTIMMYGYWDMESNGHNYLSFWTVFLHFYPIWRYYHFTHVYHKWHSWCMVPEIWSMTDRSFCHFGHFLPFYPPNNPKYQNFEKMKTSENVLNKCTINNNYVMFGSWDMMRDRQNFLSFWTIFCSFTPLTNQKIKILKNWKKHFEISSFYTSVPKIMIICYTVP